MKSNICFYVNLIEDLLNSKIPIDVFERVFLYVSKRDNELSKSEEEIILKLFYAVEDYVSDHEIRDESVLNEEDLLRVAKETLQELSKESLTT
jgi:hypothetical protein